MFLSYIPSDLGNFLQKKKRRAGMLREEDSIQPSQVTYLVAQEKVMNFS